MRPDETNRRDEMRRDEMRRIEEMRRISWQPARTARFRIRSVLLRCRLNYGGAFGTGGKPVARERRWRPAAGFRSRSFHQQSQTRTHARTQMMRFRSLVVPCAILLLAAHGMLAVHCAMTDFATSDEAGHLAAGLSYWQTGRYRHYGVNPPLTKLLAAGAVLFARPNTDAIRPTEVTGARPELEIGESF